jgi:hypothetical protein
MSTAALAACGGFLLAVLWFDLMFDVQVLRPDAAAADAVDSIAGYYRRVTTDAAPMGYLVAAVMGLTVLGAAAEAIRDARARRMRVVALALAAVPVGLALVRVFPNAVVLGEGGGTPGARLALARAILWDHLFCFGALLGFVAVQLGIAATAARRAHG